MAHVGKTLPRIFLNVEICDQCAEILDCSEFCTAGLRLCWGIVISLVSCKCLTWCNRGCLFAFRLWLMRFHYSLSFDFARRCIPRLVGLIIWLFVFLLGRHVLVKHVEDITATTADFSVNNRLCG